MFIRYNEAGKIWEYDTSASQTGVGPWVKLPIDYSQLINTPPIITIPHHATHEPGGSDALANAAWVNLYNTFDGPQVINNPTVDAGPKHRFPGIVFNDRTQPVDQRIWRFVTASTQLYIQATNDAEDAAPGFVIIERSGNLTVGGLSTLNGGAKFPTRSSDAQVLDRYEEGTYLPGLSASDGGVGTAYFIQTGFYTIIGNIIICQFDIQIQSANWSSGAIFITFPIVAASNFSSGSISYFSGLNGAFIGIYPLIEPSSSNAAIYYKNAFSNGVDGGLQVGNIASGSRFIGTMVYRIQ